VLNTVEPDECCCKRLVKELGRSYDGQTWTCPKCGTEWRCEHYKLDNGEGISHWRPQSTIMLIE